MVQDPYAVLGVSRSATEEEIKQAYRRLAKRYHPDLHPGDAACAAKMNEINEAYDAIKNPHTQSQTTYTYNPYGGQTGQQRQNGTYYSYGPFDFRYAWGPEDENQQTQWEQSPFGQYTYHYRRRRHGFLGTLVKYAVLFFLITRLVGCMLSPLYWLAYPTYPTQPQSTQQTAPKGGVK